MRRILSFALAVLMVVSSVVVGAVSVTASSGEATGGSTGTDLSVSVGASGNVGSADDLGAILANGGTGIGAGEVGAVELTYKPAEIPDDALAITSADEFAQMGSTGAYYLANDIEISSSNLIFSGELYGNGKTVTTSVPLFETLEGASVYDLTIAGTIDMAGESEVGALVRNASSVYIYSVTNNANVSAYNRPSGIIGTLKGSANLVNCVNNGTITATGNECSGMVGRLVCNTSTSVTNTALVVFESCTNDGTLNAKGNAAGMLGWAGDLEYTPTGGAKVSYLNKSIIVRNCVNTGDITSGTRGGGMLGTIYAASVVIENSENDGNITSSGHGAGMVGWINNYTTTDEIVIKNCINTGEIVTKADAGGIAGYIQAVKGSVIIDNCINDNKTTTTGGNRASGILAACDAVNITVTNCTNTEKGDTSTIHYGGGIVGRGEASELLLIENCINLGDFTAVHTSKDRRAAGIFCYNTGSAGAVVINNCVNKGTITGTLRSAGIANTVQGDSLTIINCTNAGKVESPDGIASGIITYTYANPGLIQNCENSADIEGAGHTGGIAAQIAGGTDGIIISNCRNNNAVYSTEGCAGGILSNANGGLITIEYCENAKTAKVTAGDNTKNDANHAGGIIAAVGNGGTVLTVDSCKNEGSVENLNTSCNSQTVGKDKDGDQNSYVDIFAAGIIARCWDAKMITITNCVNSGTITNAQAETGEMKVTDPDTGEEVTVKLRNTSSVAGIVCGIGGGVKEILIENCTQTGALGSETQAYAGGMFDYSNAAKTTVKNCLTEGTVTARDFACGVGTRNGSGTATLTVQNCKNTATVEAKLASGILGKISTGTLIIENCVNDGVIHATDWTAGGIFAEVFCAEGTVTVDNCINKKTVTSDGGYAGGIVTKIVTNNKVNPSSITIKNCTNTAKIIGASEASGILTGGVVKDTVSLYNCINNATITGGGSGRPGGVIGVIYCNNVKLEKCINTANGTVTAGTNYMGGVAGRIDSYETVVLLNVLNAADVKKEKQKETDPDPLSYAGGIVGYMDKCKSIQFTNVVNLGDVKAPGLNAKGGNTGGIGGIVGSISCAVITEELIFDSCVSIGTIASHARAGGLIGTITGLKDNEDYQIKNCLVVGKVEGSVKAASEIGGVIGYGEGNASRGISVINTAVYADITSTGQNVSPFIAYTNSGRSDIKIQGNVFVGSLKAETEGASVILGFRSSSQTMKDGVLADNYYLLNSGSAAFTGAAYRQNDGGSTTALTADHATDMSTLTDQDLADELNAIALNASATADVWSYVSADAAIEIEGTTVSGNIPASVVTLLNSDFVTKTDGVGYSDAYTDEEDYVAPGASGAGLVSGVKMGAVEADTGVKDYSQPVKIGSAEEFLAMLPGGNYILTADITLPSSYTLPFAGILDGDGHSVTVKDAPVFAKLSAGTVKDLTVNGEITDTASAYVGALAPVANFSCLVNVTNEANVTAAGMAGGLIGTVHNGISVIDCTNSGNVTSSAKMAGGLVGYGGTYTTVYYESCVNTGDVTANLLAGGITANIVGTANLVDCSNEGDVTSNTSYAGGIVAFVGNYVNEDGAFLLSPRSDALPIGASDKKNDAEDAFIQRSYLYAGDPLEQHVFENCTNSGDISGVLYSAGILAQTFDSVTFRSCSNSGDISGDMTQELMAGGIASCIAYEGTFYFCENSGTITGNSRVGGIVASIGDFTGSIVHGPEGAVKFIACVHSGKVVTNGAFATSATRTAAGIAGYVRVDYGYQSIIFRYCGVTGTVEATLDKTAAGKTVGGTVAGVFSGYVNNGGVTFENNYFTGNITVDGIGDAVLLSYNKSNKISADRIVNNYTVDVPGMYYLLDTAGYHKVPEEFIIGLENDGTVDYEALCETMNSGIVLDPAGNTAEVFLYENEKIVVDLDATSKAPASSAPVSVRNEEEFLRMDPNGNYYLINDITISRSYEYVFRGSFDGKGFKVTTSAPLFKNVENASISNLKIDGEVSYNSRATGAVVCEANGVVLTNITNNADVTNANNGSGDYTGGLIGTVSGAVRIDNCRNNGMISGVNPGGMVGGTMNYVEFTAVNSVNIGTITNYSLTASNAGGFIAKAFNGNYAFADCTNTGLVTFNSANSGSTAGGFIGAVDTPAAKTLNMRNCVNGANVIGNGWVGGLLGYARATLSLDNCVNTGKIISKSNYAGGLVSRADYGGEDSSVKHIFTSCVNTGDVYAHRQYAAGIIGLSYNSVTATYCLNTGKMSIDEQRRATCSEHGCHTGTSNAYLQAAGIAASVVGTGIFEYCVNTGELSGTARAAGIVSAMGSGAPGAQTSGHQITGCVNTGRVYNSAKYNAGSTDTGASGINCYAWGSVTISYCTVGGEIINEGTSNRTSPLCLYSNNGGTKFHNNVIVTDTIEGPNRQLLNWYNKNNAPTKSNVNNYVMKDVVDYEYRDQKSVTYVEMSDSYKYYFTAEELWSGDLADKLDDNFAKDTLYPMHNEVVAVYERADVDPDSYIPDGTLPEVRDEETSNEGDESTTEPDDETTTEPDGGENTTEPDGETTTEPDGGENTTEPDDETTTEPDGGESTTEPEVSDPVGTDKPDDGGSGCGSVVSATVALAALALIAPAAICLKKRDEE